MADREHAPDTLDARIYAISPGSAAFLRAVGAWQALRCERIAAIESMHVEGDGGGSLDFSAYDLGERALAWIVEERELRSALLRTARRAGVHMIGDATLDALMWSAAAGTLRLSGGPPPGTRVLPMSRRGAPRGGRRGRHLGGAEAGG